MARHTLVLALVIFACDAERTIPHQGRLAIGVAPLELGGVACYSIAVSHADTLVFETPWVCSGPAVDDHGNAVPGQGSGPLGDLVFIGACIDDNDDGPTMNRVVVTLHTLFDANGAARRDLDLPPPFVRDVLCEENGDTRVDVSFVVMRGADHGFLDLVVRFEDIACSAKVDCAEELVPIGHPGLDGIVIALACRSDTSAFTPLFMDTIRLACVGRDGASTVVDVDPTDSPGLFSATPATSFVAAAVGSEGRIADDGASYWTIAIGLGDLDAFASCAVMSARMTAGLGRPLSEYGAYPVIGLADSERGIPFWDGEMFACQSPLDASGSGLGTAYVGGATLAFQGCLQPANAAEPLGSVVTRACAP